MFCVLALSLISHFPNKRDRKKRRIFHLTRSPLKKKIILDDEISGVVFGLHKSTAFDKTWVRAREKKSKNNNKKEIFGVVHENFLTESSFSSSRKNAKRRRIATRLSVFYSSTRRYYTVSCLWWKNYQKKSRHRWEN